MASCRFVAQIEMQMWYNVMPKRKECKRWMQSRYIRLIRRRQKR